MLIKSTKNISIIAAIALLFFSCSTDLNMDPPDEPTITVIPGGVGGDWADCGGKLGAHACNFVAKDARGNDWQLYEQYGKIIVLDFSTLWCSVCMHAATHVQELQDRYDSEDVVWVTVLLQDFYGQLPSVELAAMWADAFEIKTSPVLAANESVVELVLADGYAVSVLPTIVIIDRGMVNTYMLEGWNKDRIIDQLNTMLLAEI